MIRIKNPIDHIEQGDSYGDDLRLAHSAHVSNAEKTAQYVEACDKGHGAEVRAWEKREAIRAKALDEVEKLLAD